MAIRHKRFTESKPRKVRPFKTANAAYLRCATPAFIQGMALGMFAAGVNCLVIVLNPGSSALQMVGPFLVAVYAGSCLLYLLGLLLYRSIKKDDYPQVILDHHKRLHPEAYPTPRGWEKIEAEPRSNSIITGQRAHD